jgi:hypothetical protein
VNLALYPATRLQTSESQEGGEEDRILSGQFFGLNQIVRKVPKDLVMAGLR